MPEAAPPLVQRVKVAVLLPLTGPNQELGQAMLKAAELALFDVGEAGLELVPKDTGDTPAGAREAAQAALAEGAEALVGPFGAPAVRVVAPLAQARGAPVFAFSTDRTVAGNGVYLMGFMPDAQVARVVTYAAQQGAKKFAALVPDDAFGTAISAALRKAVQQAGGTVERLERLEAQGQNVEPVRRVADGGAPYDALLVPEGGARLRQIAPLLSYFEIDTTRVRLLGTAQWDDPNIGRVTQVVGGWFAGPPPSAWATFARRWADAYATAQPPPRFTAFAYDAVALAAAQARLPRDFRFKAESLTNPAGFAGANGIFRFGADGVPEHGLAVLQVAPDGPIVVDPAGDAFAGPGG
jgi:ABC-type branched-subunit amino acid transport system substrate-binding protein